MDQTERTSLHVFQSHFRPCALSMATTHQTSYLSHHEYVHRRLPTLLQMLSSIVKTNRLHHCGSSALVSTSKRSKPPSWMHQFLKPSHKNHTKSCHCWSQPSNANMENHTLGPLARVANSLPATSWPKTKKRSEAVVPSFILWTHPFDQCSISWPD